MSKITFIHRNFRAGYSIRRVYSPIIKRIAVNQIAVGELFLPYFGANPIKILKNIFYVYKHRNKNGINHMTGDAHYVLLGLIGCKSILTIHDFVFIHNAKNKFDKFIKWLFWIYLPVKIADKVVCISNRTKELLMQYISIPENKVTIIHNPCDESFTYSEKQFNASYPVILHIGTGWNKNLPNVIKALKGIPCHLRIIGKLKEEDLRLLEENEIDYYNAYHLSDMEIVKEYQDCDIISFPSIYEGFGMPIIEGQATGRIVLTSDLSPMNEVGADSVTYVDPSSINSIKEGFMKIIDEPDYREVLRSKSRMNVKKFSSSKIFEQYMYLYEELQHKNNL